jgi:hypothetical protein
MSDPAADRIEALIALMARLPGLGRGRPAGRCCTCCGGASR